MTPEESKAEFIRIFQEDVIPVRPGAADLLYYLEKQSSFFTDPASGKYHLNVPGGLCQHSLNVYHRLMNLVATEPYLFENGGFPAPGKDSIAVIALLHDLCKIGCYQQEARNQKNYDPEKVKAAGWGVKHDQLGDFIWETVMQYKFDDPMPYGHGEKSVYIISGYMKLSREEAFAIRYHMGPWQDGEKNNVNKTFELYPLAVLAHIADMQATYFDERES